MANEAELLNLSRNLAHLCRGRSVAAFCRDAGINRQQFNKYLAGKHLPSRRNLAAICRHFSVGEKDLFREHAAFAKLYGSGQSDAVVSLLHLKLVSELVEEMISSHDVLREFEGFYDRYQYSSIYSGAVLRSALRIFQNEGMTFYKYVERFPDLDNPNRTAYLFKYNGICIHRGGRVFMIDAEALQRNEMTFSIVTSVTRSRKRFLYGLTTGVAATPYREPFSTKVAFEFLGTDIDARYQLKRATTLTHGDVSIPVEVMNYLGRPHDTEQVILRGR